MIVTLLLKHEMHMTRPPRVSPQPPQHLADRPIIRNTIRHGDDSLIPKYPLFITAQHRSTVRILSLVMLVLYVIYAVRVRFPDVNLHVCYRVAGGCLHGAETEEGFAIGVGGD